MTVNYLPVREYIQKQFINFPWASETQTEAICTTVDHLLAGRRKGRKSLLRSGMTLLSDRQLQYQLRQSLYYLDCMKDQQSEYNNNFDLRKIHQLSFDDIIKSRTGKNVYASSYQYNHSKSSVEWGQTVVDMVLVTDHVLGVDYQVYLPQSYLERNKRSENEFETKIEITKQLFNHHCDRLVSQNIPKEKIWVSVDCWYPSEDLIAAFRQKEVNIAMGLKKDTRCNLFGRLVRLDNVFKLEDPWKHRTTKRSGKKVFFQEKTLNLNRQGRCKVFAVRRGDDKRIRYYGTNLFQISFDRFLERLSSHWQVETMHHDIKQYFGFDKCVTGSEILNNLHWNLCYLIYHLFRQYQWDESCKGSFLTISQLVELYCYQYDEERSLKCFSTPSKRALSRKRLIGGLC